MAYMNYSETEGSCTYRLDSTTTALLNASGAKATDIIGKVVAFVTSTTEGEPMVGYGTANDYIAGVVTSIDEENGTDTSKYVVTVKRGAIFNNIATASTSTTAVVGKGVAVDGAGGVVKSTTVTDALCIAIDSTSTKCMIRL